ncbi:hypothetical protein ART_4044 [Arthrobacter sp. PAMC 25486]|uniref:alternate-type signal peptide domain-containing protein n=1 Tax=Arthrobacter sp. PAMC 25486 TaxID=1494608 RepID=UPI000535E427|nr:alternate-type signal peptide domain-containing protein [Arthrobacter sp. PAMC 25486]AIY03643.1 hypothetical protein ART_4044 [Arthrobacter sp. PAMC 25486]
MKKVTKAAVAAGAAAALMLGGAGSLALWNDSKTVDAGTITTGHLKMTSDTGKWTDAANAVFDPITDHIVPGDTLTFNQTVTIEADGKNLKGKLTVPELSEDLANLPEDTTVNLTVVPPAGVTLTEGAYSFDGPGTYAVPVSITIVFPEAAEATMNHAINVGSLALTLEQVR